MPRTGSVLAVLALALASCRAINPPPLLEARCEAACEREAHQCSRRDCDRGCAFILDRLVEGERDPVLACVARSEKACDDPVWAECAVAVGVHADGGPPAPTAPAEE